MEVNGKLRRIIVYTGKGGVGKTTIAAATGVLISRMGYKTLVMSTDPAHSLSDTFGTQATWEPMEVVDNLFIQEVDVNREIERNWGPVKQFFEGLFMERGLDEISADELSVFPGMDEVFSLILMRDHYLEDRFDIIVVDCAPTAETLRLLSVPDIARWYTEKLFKIEKGFFRKVRPLAKHFVDAPIPGEDVFACVEKLYLNLEGVRKLLTDPELSSVRLVTNPEKVVLKETLRTYTFLHLFGFSVDAVIINKILPKIKKGFGKRWRAVQEKYISEIEASFYPIPVIKAMHFDREIVGTRRLRSFGRKIFVDRNPVDIFFKEKPIEISQEGDAYVLKLKIPFVPKEEIDAIVRGDELTVRIKNFKRTFVLPRALYERELKGAKYQDGVLRFVFQ